MKALLSLLLVVASFTASAQTKTGADYYEGQWNVLFKGTPNGDVKLIFHFEKKDGGLTGVVQDSTGTEIAKMDKVELSGDKVTVYFSAGGYDLAPELTKKDDDHITGNLMGMFEVEGDRVKKPAVK